MGFRVKELRERKLMTQEELAKKSGISRMTISAIENDPKYAPTTRTLVKLAEALEVPVTDIFFAKTV